jgi:hypothetical protein
LLASPGPVHRARAGALDRPAPTPAARHPLPHLPELVQPLEDLGPARVQRRREERPRAPVAARLRPQVRGLQEALHVLDLVDALDDLAAGGGGGGGGAGQCAPAEAAVAREVRNAMGGRRVRGVARDVTV